MVLNSALADAEIRGDNLAGLACENQFHDLALSRSEACDVVCRSLPPGEQLARIPRLFESSLDAGEQFAGADRLLDEVRSACLHGLNRHRHVGIAGDHDGRQPMARIMEPLQQFEAVHPGQVGIDQEACSAARTIGFEECLASRIIFDGLAIFLEHRANSPRVCGCRRR